MNEKKTKNGLAIKMLLITGVAILLLYAGLLVTAITSSRNNTKKLYSEKLTSIAVSVTESYDCMMDGDYSLKDGKVYKGDIALTEDLLDRINQEDGVHMTVFYGDTRYLTTIKDSDGNRIIGTKASDEVIDSVLKNGKAYTTENVDIQGVKYFATYEPLKNGDEVVGILFIGLEQSKIYGAIKTLVIRLVVVGSILVVLLLVISSVENLLIVKTVKSVAKDLDTLTNGNLDIDCRAMKVNEKDELGALAFNANKLSAKLKEILGAIQSNSDVLNNDSSKLYKVVEETLESVSNVVAAMEDVASEATSQAETAADLMANIEELSANLDMISSQVESLDQTTRSVSGVAENTKETMLELLQSNANTKNSIEAIVTQSKDTLQAVEEINSIVMAIEEITSQTNLLSLNASIEAARAGDAGKGFAVVAGEIGKLAQESADSAQRITEITENIIAKVEKSGALSDELNRNAVIQISKLDETHKSMEKVIDGVMNINKNTDNINTEVKSLEQVKMNIGEATEKLSASSQENAAAAQETSASATVIESNMSLLKNSSNDISNVAADLKEAISYFK